MARSVAEIRAEFPGLEAGTVRLDGAAGTLVPTAVIEAVADAMRFAMANTHGEFSASARSTRTVAAARRAVADLVGGSPDGVILGPNMTTLTFHLADAIAAGWRPGDEVVVTSLDHDANIRPWVLAAERAGATVRWAEFDVETGELPGEAFDRLIGDRTRLVAFTAASNAIGTRPDVRAIADRAHAAGALTYVDGVHATPHGPTDVDALAADFYACSTYKLFGPHLGAVIASPALLDTINPTKLVPAPAAVPDRFERGTPPFELLAGAVAAVDWLAGLTRRPGRPARARPRRTGRGREPTSSRWSSVLSTVWRGSMASACSGRHGGGRRRSRSWSTLTRPTRSLGAWAQRASRSGRATTTPTS